MAEQIIVLLALTAGLFDRVSLDKVSKAEKALQKAMEEIPADVGPRFDSAEKLSDADKKAVLDVATRALASFQPKPDAQPSEAAS